MNNPNPDITRETPLKEILRLAPACRCGACAHGCTMGSGFLAESDFEPLAKFLGITVDELKRKHLEPVEQLNKTVWRPKLERKDGKPYGKCTFYDAEKGCTVHPAKPLHCKVSMGCKPYAGRLHAWFVLNHMLNKHDPEALRQYADYLAAGGETIPGGSIEELVPDKKQREQVMGFGMLK